MPSSLKISLTTSYRRQWELQVHKTLTYPGINLALVTIHDSGDMVLQNGSQRILVCNALNP